MSDKIKARVNAPLATSPIDFASSIEKLYQQHRFQIKPAANA
jgi:hypothetical protein